MYRLSAFQTIEMMCLMVVFKHWLFSEIYFHPQLLFTGLLWVLTTVYYCGERSFSALTRKTFVHYYFFTLHLLFVSVCVSFGCDLLFIIFKTLFIFGFIQMIIYFIIFMMLFWSDVLYALTHLIYQTILQYTLGIVVPLELSLEEWPLDRVLAMSNSLIRNCFWNYIYRCFQIIYFQLLMTYNCLANNSASQMIHQKMLIHYNQWQTSCFTYMTQLMLDHCQKSFLLNDPIVDDLLQIESFS